MAKKRKPSPKSVPSQLAKLRKELAQLVPGATKDTPITVESASIVEARALEAECVGCGGRSRLLEHTVVRHGDHTLRAVRVGCAQCPSTRTLYVRIASRPVH